MGPLLSPTSNYVSKSKVTQEEEASPCNSGLSLTKMFCHGVTSAIFSSFSCAAQLFTIERRDPGRGWSAKHAAVASQYCSGSTAGLLEDAKTQFHLARNWRRVDIVEKDAGA